jgi:hypothetical protein
MSLDHFVFSAFADSKNQVRNALKQTYFKGILKYSTAYFYLASQRTVQVI